MNQKPDTQQEEESTRERILRSAAELFARHGYDATSTRQITQHAGVNLGAIQYYFGSKQKLFVDTVHAILLRSHYLPREVPDLDESFSAEEAAQHLKDFIHSLLSRLLLNEEPKACQLMMREVLSEGEDREEFMSELVSSTVKEFIGPTHERLSHLLQIIVPDLGDSEASSSALSVVGQCFFYFGHQPIVEEVCCCSLKSTEQLDQIVEHVWKFSLRGIGCSSKFLEKVCQ